MNRGTVFLFLSPCTKIGEVTQNMHRLTIQVIGLGPTGDIVATLKLGYQ